jgi:hypothetical protein
MARLTASYDSFWSCPAFPVCLACRGSVGTVIAGFDEYHYKYASGHEGDMCMIGFSPRAQALTLYMMPGFASKEELLRKLGKHKTGKGCLYINKLADVDLQVLEQMLRDAYAWMKQKYPGSMALS